MTLSAFIKISLITLALFGISILTAQQVPASNIKAGTVKYHPNGLISHARLLAAQEIQGFPCKNWVAFSPAGKLIAFDSSKLYQMGQDRIPAGSRFALYETGEIKHILLAKVTRIQGYLCVGYGLESPEINFWQNGKLKSAYLKQATVINGLTAKAGSFSPVQFAEDGSLTKLTLDKAATVEGKSYKAGTILSFGAGRKLLKAERPGYFKRMGTAIMDSFV